MIVWVTSLLFQVLDSPEVQQMMRAPIVLDDEEDEEPLHAGPPSPSLSVRDAWSPIRGSESPPHLQWKHYVADHLQKSDLVPRLSSEKSYSFFCWVDTSVI